MKKIFFFLIVIISLTSCSSNKFNIGNIKIDLGKFPEKEEAGLKENAAMLYSTALAAKEQEDYGTYLLYLTSAYSDYPQSEELTNEFIPLLYTIGESEKNESIFKEIIKIKNWASKNNIHFPKLYLYSALSYEQLHKNKKAEKMYLEGLKFNPDNIELLTSYHDFILKTKKYHDKKILDRIFQLVKDDEGLAEKFVSSLINNVPEISITYAKYLYEKYNDKQTFRVLIANYVALKELQLAVNLIWQKVKNKEEISEDIYSAFLMELADYDEYNISVDSLKTYIEPCEKKSYEILKSYLVFLDKKKLYDDAYNCFQKAIKDTNFISYLNNLQPAFYSVFATNVYLKANRSDDLKKLLADLKNEPEIKYYIVETKIENHRDSLAFIDKFKKIIDSFDNPDVKRFYYAAYYEALGDNDKAYNELLGLSEDFKKSSLNLTSFLTKHFIYLKNDIKIALKVAEYMENDSLSANYLVAAYLSSVHQDSLAQSLILKDLHRDIVPLSEIGMIFYYFEDKEEFYDDILQMFERNEKRYSNVPEFLNNYGYFIVIVKRKDLYPKAEELLKKANKLEPDNIYYIDSIAWLYYQMGNLDKAFEYMDKINFEKIDYSEIAYHYGILKLKQKKLKEAKKAFKLAIDLNDSPKYKSLAEQKLFELGERNN